LVEDQLDQQAVEHRLNVLHKTHPNNAEHSNEGNNRAPVSFDPLPCSLFLASGIQQLALDPHISRAVPMASRTAVGAKRASGRRGASSFGQTSRANMVVKPTTTQPQRRDVLLPR